MKREYQEVIAMIHMPEDCEARILATLKQKPKKFSRRLGRVLLAAAVICVMLTSAVALCVGVLAAKFMSRMGRRKK